MLCAAFGPALLDLYSVVFSMCTFIIGIIISTKPDAALILRPAPPASKAQPTTEPQQQQPAAGTNGDDANDRADDSSDDTEMNSNSNSNSTEGRRKSQSQQQQQAQAYLFRGITPAGQRLLAHPVRAYTYIVHYIEYCSKKVHCTCTVYSTAYY